MKMQLFCFTGDHKDVKRAWNIWYNIVEKQMGMELSGNPWNQFGPFNQSTWCDSYDFPELIDPLYQIVHIPTDFIGQFYRCELPSSSSIRSNLLSDPSNWSNPSNIPTPINLFYRPSSKINPFSNPAYLSF